MTLDEAVDLARTFHAGAVDKGGQPYIEHPLRVMARVSTDEEKLAAVLHDLLEDTELSATDLVAAGCPARVIQALDALTRRPDETYEDFIERAVADPLARAVKRADIADNLDPDRLGRLDPGTADALRAKYHRAQARVDAADAAGAAGEPPASKFSVGEPEGPPVGPFARFDCAACGHPAWRAELRETGIVVTSPLGRVWHRTGPAQAERAAEAVTARDVAALHRIHPEFAPYWCPRCDRSYCDRHWSREVVIDDGFYDCTYGTCPEGHRRMLDD